MANGYDGDIKLSVSLSPEEAQQSAKRLQKEIQDIFNKTSGQNLDSSFQKLLTNMSKATSRSEALQKSLEKVSNTQVQTKEYTKLENTISSLEAKIESAKVKQAQFLEGGGKESSRTFENMNSNIAMLEDKLFDAQKELQTLVDEGKQFTINEDGIEQAKNALADNNNQLRMMIENVAQYQGTMSEASQQNAQKVMSTWERVAELFKRIGTDIRHPIQAIQRLRENSDDAGKSAEQTATKFSRFSGVTSSIGSVLGKVGSALKTLAQRFLHAGNASKGFDAKLKRGFWNIMKYGLGIRSLYVLFRRLRSAITESLTTMAMMNGGVNQTNTAISALVSSLNYLKGALGAAFAPILTVVSPILSNLIDQIAGVITAIGMMIAKLTGAKSYFRAVKTSTDYAASKAGGGSSGKSAEEKYQEAVEKAQKKYDEQVAKTQEKNAKAAAKAEEKQAKAAKKLAEQQEKANRKLADFDDLNVLNIEDMEELEEIEADVYDMPELELPDKEDFQDAMGGGAGDPFGLEEVPLDDWEWNWDDLLAKAEELGRKFADILNDIFADEDLAKKIGNAIGNLINMAIRFAYGFVDEFNFRQFGRWIGTLIQEAIETIEWDTLGKTIGKFVNGIADTIIGFFERYQVGTLADSIATMINNAIETVNPELIGEAVADLLKAPLIELSHFFNATNWTLMAQKFSEFFHNVFTNEELGGEKLGRVIGKTIGAAINAAIDFLLGLDIYQIVLDLGLFFEDIFVGAVGEIKWIKVLEALVEGIGGIFEALHTLVTIWVNELVVAAMEGLNELTGLELIPQEAIDDAKTKIEAMKEGIYTATEVAKGAADIWAEKMREIGDGTQYSRDQLIRWQEAGGLTNEQIELMIQSMEEYAQKNHTVFDEAKLGLEGYTGDWQTFRDTVLGVIDETDEKMKGSKQTIEDLGNTSDLLAEKSKNAGSVIKEEADTTAEKLDHTAAIGKDHLGILDEAIDTSDQNVNAYSDSAVEALSQIDAKTGEVSINFEQMTALVQTQLDSLTTLVDTWYQEMITTYFSYDAWLVLLQEGMLLAFTDFFVTYFFVMWDEQMQLWWDEHVLKWFKNDWWNEQVYTPWETFRNQKWSDLMKWWDSMMKSWWDTKVVPWFKEQKWEEQFNHVYKVAQKVGEKTRDKIKELATETEEAVHEACNRMKEWIQEIIEMLHEAIELAEELASAGSGGGGGGSSSGGSGGNGGYSNGGGGGSGGFLPAINIMHFEDNLGMSAFKFPELATGAVIPPNNKFLAVLGDQKSGMNIETPLATMVEAFRSVMDEYMNPSMRNATMEVDGETFARLMMPHMMDEMNRLGYNTEIIEGM